MAVVGAVVDQQHPAGEPRHQTGDRGRSGLGRTQGGVDPAGSLRTAQWQVEHEAAASGDRALGMEIAADPLRELFADRLPQAGATVLTGHRVVGLHERMEQAFELFGRHARAGVDDADQQPLAAQAWTVLHFDADLALLGELDGVAAHFEAHLAHADRIPEHRIGELGGPVQFHRRPFASARARHTGCTSRTISTRDISTISTRIVPASIFAESSTSSIKAIM